MNAVSTITLAIGMPIVLTRMVAITVAVWRALKGTEQFVKVLINIDIIMHAYHIQNIC